MSTLRSILLATLIASPSSAQTLDTLTVGGDSTYRAVAVLDQGFAAFPITLLAPLGAEFAVSQGRHEVRVFGRTLGFRVGYGTFTENGMIMSLHYPAYERGGVLYVPEQFFTEWIPARYPRNVRYSAETGTLKRFELVVAAATPPAMEPRQSRPVGVDSTTHRLSADPLFTTEEPPMTSTRTPELTRRVLVPATDGEMYVRLSGWYSDNFFQAPSEGLPTELKATTGEMRLVVRSLIPGLNVQARVNRTHFERFDPSMAAVAVIDWTVGPHSLEFTGGRQSRSPRLLGGDQAGFANTTHGAVGYGLMLPGKFQASALGHHYNIRQHGRPGEFRLSGAGGALRWRGLGSRFSPEVGAMESRWEGGAESETYVEQTRWALIRASPWSSVYLNVRYREDARSYSISSPSASNYGREDTRGQWTISTDVRITRRLAWGVYYTFDDGKSTRVDRTFRTQSIISGLSYRIW